MSVRIGLRLKPQVLWPGSNVPHVDCRNRGTNHGPRQRFAVVRPSYYFAVDDQTRYAGHSAREDGSLFFGEAALCHCLAKNSS